MDEVVTERKHGRPLTFSYLVLKLFFSLYLINSIDSNLRSRVGCDNIDNVSVRCLIPDFLRCKWWFFSDTDARFSLAHSNSAAKQSESLDLCLHFLSSPVWFPLSADDKSMALYSASTDCLFIYLFFPGKASKATLWTDLTKKRHKATDLTAFKKLKVFSSSVEQNGSWKI